MAGTVVLISMLNTLPYSSIYAVDERRKPHKRSAFEDPLRQIERTSERSL